MPYIDQGARDHYRAMFNELNGIEHPGHLNYLITCLVREYLWSMHGDEQPNYQTLNEVVGVLECAKQEFYRRMVAPYEDEKIEENGDVY